ncbi:PTS mannitol transporter subunit IICBA [Aerococcus urinaeequi]|uniref:PTS mannitol transporter subunit IICBA n=1 Tax=Aerococcus urinaeequi TaxID=51665 RepID=UPI003D6C2CC3
MSEMSTSTVSDAGSNTKISMKTRIQKFGSYLSSMIMPNIGAFISWGIITALFLATGWLPNEELAQMIDPMKNYLLPLLIAYSGGSLVHGQRGAVVGAIGTMGVVVGSEIPMFLGAMLMGPFAGWLLKQFDDKFADKIPQGFEMLVNNFSSGILGFILAVLGYYFVGPTIGAITDIASVGIQAIISDGFLPLANVITEPAKVIFLNNAVNHGIFTPLGAQQAQEAGKSILYLVSINPGVGGGMLLAYMLFGSGSAKSSAPGAFIIQFFGGIHEMYFPYVLMKPLMVLAVIGGWVTGTAIFQLFDVGLVGPASPGSIISVVAMTPPGDLFGILLGVFGAFLVSFAIGVAILKFDRSEGKDFEASKDAVQAEKRAAKGQTTGDTQVAENVADVPKAENVNKIIFACDAGMGSSAMGASLLRKKAKQIKLNIPISNSAINNLQDEPGTLVISQNELTPRARRQNPSGMHVSVDNFLDGARYDEILGAMIAQPIEVKETDNTAASQTTNIAIQNIDNIYLPFEDKVGETTMAASILRNKLKKINIHDVTVKAVAVEDLVHTNKTDATLVIGNQAIVQSLQELYPDLDGLVIEDLLEASAYDQLIES